MKAKGDEHGSEPSSQNSILTMPTLPQDLVTKILLKLPVKSLLKFRCVEKSWLSLISSSAFVKAHLLLSASDKDYTHHGVIFGIGNPTPDVKELSLSSLLCHSSDDNYANDLDYPGKDRVYFPQIAGTFNGLICFADWSSADGVYDLFLWNPSIRKYNKLPHYGLDVSHRIDEDVRVFFNFCFAYDELQDDYKVVGIFPVYGRPGFEAKMFSLKANSWKPIDDFPSGSLVDHPGKLVNGKLHWLDMRCNVISIDLADEKWHTMELPRHFEQYHSLQLGVFGSDLYVSGEGNGHPTDIWVMKEYGVKDSWSKMFTFKAPDHFMGDVFHPVFISSESEILFSHRLGFLIHSPKDDPIRYTDVKYYSPRLGAEVYVKSLVFPAYQECNNRN